MACKHTKLAVAIVAGLFAMTPALATITVSFDPPLQTVDILDGTTTVDLVADIPAADAIVSWGLDLNVLDSSVSLASIAINEPLFSPAASLDGDGLAALVPFGNSPISGQVTLATLTFDLAALGLTPLTLSDDNPIDLTEGFALNPPPTGAFAEVEYETATINVIPEPASLVLLAGGACYLLRRRR